MTLSPKPSADFDAEAFTFIGLRELLEQEVYGDGIGVPTVGYGYALVVRGANGWALKQTLDADLQFIGITLTTSQRSMLEQIAVELAIEDAGLPNFAQSLSDALGDQSASDHIRQITPIEAETLFALELARAVDAVKAQFRNVLGTANGDALHASLVDSVEMVALASLAYNAQTLIGPRLTQALWSGDRAEVWFEIRYRSNSLDQNPIIRDGIARRRYEEATQFGLYNDNPTESDFIAAYRMYTKYRNANIYGQVGLLGYEGSFATQPPSTIETALQLARAGLASRYGVPVSPSGAPGVAWDHIFVGGNGIGTGDVDLIIGDGASDSLDAGAGNDVLVGGIGNDVLRGGAGDDTYYFEAGDGDDTIVGNDDDGRIKVDSVVLTGAGSVAWVDPQRQDRPGWRWMQDNRTFYATLTEGDYTSGTLLIRPGQLGGGDSITIEDWSSDDLGLTLAAAPQPALLPGARVANPYSDPNFVASTENLTLSENLAAALALAFNMPLPPLARLLITVGQQVAQLFVTKGDETLPFVNGAVEFELAAGQNLVNLALHSAGDFDADQQVTLTATLLDAQGAPIGTAATMNVLFEATVEPEGTPPIDGQTFIETAPYSPYRSGTLLNDRMVGYDGAAFVDKLHGLSASDWIQGGVGRDTLYGFANDLDQPTSTTGGGPPDGEDLIEGGADGDVIYGGGAADRLYADTVVDLAVAITAGNAAPSIAENGDILQGGAGHDLAIGSNRIDVIGGGEGNDVLVGGGGNDLLDGDATYVAGSAASFNFETWLGMWALNVTVVGDTVSYDVVGSQVRDYLFDYDMNHVPYDGGTDTIYAGTGNDLALAGGGDDFIDAGPGDDNVFGQDGNDTLLGGAGNDRLDAGGGSDLSGDDFLDGGDNDDRLFGSGYNDVLYGGSGNDYLQADDHDSQDGEDYLDGEDGNDTLYGGGGADRLLGGAGNDELFGESSAVLSTMHGNDYLDGGDGDDTLHGRGGADTLIGGAGVDTLFGDLQTETVLFGADYLSGGAGNDVLVGAGGADTLEGGDNDDQLYGDSASTPTAVHGADQISGGTGNDTVFAGGGNDSVTGGDNNDILYGEAGNDQLRGDAGDDYLQGDDGDDMLSGGDDTDTLYGGAGNDVLTGGAGADYLNGGAGDDTYFFSGADLAPVNNVLETLDDTSGNDTVVFDASMSLSDLVVGSPVGSSNLRISNSSDTAVLSIAGLLSGASSVRQFRFASGEVVSAARLISERYGQAVSGVNSAENGMLFGGNQADTLEASGNGATISGGLGDDYLIGSPGATTYQFTRGDGNDSITDASSGNGVLNALELTNVFLPELSLRYSVQAGADLLVSGGGGSMHLGTFDIADVFSPRTIDEIRFIDAETTMTWSQFVNAVGIDIEGDAAPVINGSAVTDRIAGSSTNETINAGAGNDYIDGGLGNDTMDGGAGSDTYVFRTASGQDTINNSDLAAGKTDVLVVDSALTRAELRLVRFEDSLVIRVAATNDRVFVTNYFAGAGLDQIRLAGGLVYTPGNIVLDSVQSQATSGDDEIYGSPSGDAIDALAGNDSVFAGSGDDTVLGNDGDDVLHGQAGNDTLDGGAGIDTLYGGDGNDVLSASTALTDTMYGEAGNDQLTGSGTLDGGTGDDQITGQGTLIGGDGADVVTATTGGASMSGDAGNDQLFGSASSDTLTGGAGNDLLDTGTGGSDSLNGGDGSDVLLIRAGSGVATVFQDDSSSGRFDVLRFGPGILPSQITFSSNWQGNLSLQSPGMLLTLVGYLAEDGSAKKFDQIIFDSDPGTVWTGAQLDALAMVPSDQSQYFRGTLGNDTINGLGGNDYIHGRDGNDQLSGGDGQDTVYGEAGNDTLDGGLDTGGGFDDLDGGAGDDIYLYNLGYGNDRIVGIDPSTTSFESVVFGAGIVPGNVTVRRVIGAQNNILFTVYHAITGATLGTLEVVNGFDAALGGRVLDEVRFTDAPTTIWSRSDLQAMTLSGNNQDELLTGFATDDVIRGNGGNDRIDGGSCNDDLGGGAGNDALIGGMGDDTFRFGHGQGFDEIGDVSGVNRIVLDAGITTSDVTLYRTSSTTTLHSGFLPTKNADGLVLVLNGTGEQLWVRNFFSGQTPRAISEIVFANGTIWNAAAIDANTINQGGTANSATGTAGNDNFTVDHPGDTITEASGGGTDSVTSSVTYTLPSNVENLTLSGVLNTEATGNTLANNIVGNVGDNVLHGGGSAASPDAADTLTGGAGNDTYYVFKGAGSNLINDTVVESANGGYDLLVAATHSATMASNVEAMRVLTFSGSYSAIAQSYQGNALDNVIDARLATTTGYGFVIDGGAGADVMMGPTNLSFSGTVDRVLRYVVDNAGDVVIGTVASSSVVYDLVQSSVSYVLPEAVERLELTGAAAIAGTGNALDNYLNGASSSGANVLTGGAGNDEYTVGTGDTVVESVGEGTDTVVVTTAAAGGNIYDLAQFANIENLGATDAASGVTLVGNSGANALTGNASANVLTGAGGDDSLTGGAGNDRYNGFGTGSGADTITDTAGTDTVELSSAQNAQIEQLQFTQVGNNLRIGFTAQDSVTIQSYFVGTTNAIEYLELWEGGLNYRYTKAQIDARLAATNSAPVVNATPATPQAMATQAFSWALPANTFADVESQHSLTYTATRSDGTALPAWLTFNPGTRTFSGTPASGDVGALSVRVTATDPGSLATPLVFSISVNPFVLFGTTGNDTLTGDAGANVVYGLAGNDTIQGLAGIDDLNGDEGDDTIYGDAGDDSIAGGADNDLLYGGADADFIQGGAGNDLLDGGAGVDDLYGGAGNDTYVVDSASDFIEELAGEGTDTVQSNVTYTLGAELENLALIGSGSGINGNGNSLANVLDGTGNTNANTLSGGAGSDMYYVGNGDIVSEGLNAGTDSVFAGVTYTITDADVEHLVLTGTGNINGTGNSSANTLTGNSGNNTLSGGSGVDTMLGGAGDDTYTVDNALDAVTENAGEGTDLVNSSVSYTIADIDVENLTLTGTAAGGTGNGSDNVLLGNASSNTLTGLGGNDTLNGAGGSDTMVGGLGNDAYYVDVSGDVTTESANQGIDTIYSSMTRSIATLANIELLFLTGTLGNGATGNSVANLLRGNTGANALQGNGSTDILEGGGGNDTLSNTTAPGNTLFNGGAAVDTLTGTASKDLLIGGLGNDSITTGQGADIILFNQGEGMDTVASSTTKDNVLALGGGIVYADLLFQKSGNNLILRAGGTDQITFTNYYASASNRSVDKLQIVLEGTSDYISGSGDALRNMKIATFNFDGLVAAFDAALVANPGLTTWALTNALVAQHLGGSDTAAIGGDLAYRYGRFDSLSDISFTPAVALLAASGFATSAQTLQALGSLQDTSARLS